MATTVNKLFTPVINRTVGCFTLILPGWLIQDTSVLRGDALAALILALTASFLVMKHIQLTVSAHRCDTVDRILAIGLMSLGSVIAFAASMAGTYRMAMIFAAMAALVLGISSAFGGRKLLVPLVVPVLVLYLIVPLIPMFETSLSFPMRRLCALLVSFVLSIGPETVGLKGTEIYYGDLTVSVTSACDGLNMLQNMIWVAWWTVLVRHHGFWNRFAHGLIVIPAVLISNTLRIMILALWASTKGPQVLASDGHLYLGWVMVAVATFIFLSMENLFPSTRKVNRAHLKDDKLEYPELNSIKHKV